MMKLQHKYAICFILSNLFFFPYKINCQTDNYSRPNNAFIDVSIRDGKLIYKSYKSVEEREIDISDLDIWGQTSKNSPVNMFIFNEPETEFKVELLKRGLASLKKGINHQDKFINAEKEAISKNLGLWKQLNQKNNNSNQNTQIASNSNQNSQNTPNSNQNIKKVTNSNENESNQNSTDTKEGVDLSYSLDWLWKILLWLLIPTSFFTIAKLIYEFLKKRKLFIVLIGSRSAGKSAIFQRMFHPESKPDKCSNPEGTKKSEKFESNAPRPYGGYLVSSVYVDTAGGKFGEQASVLLEKNSLFRRLFKIKRNKYVWIVALSSTDDAKVTKESEEVKKINQRFVDEQYGYLSLPIALLTGKKKSLFGIEENISKPDLVISCINKCDLFSEKVNDSERDDKLKKLFNRHIQLLADNCKSVNVKNSLQIASACEGININLIVNKIERELFGKKNK